jgi:hypothetical protein
MIVLDSYTGLSTTMRKKSESNIDCWREQYVCKMGKARR